LTAVIAVDVFLPIPSNAGRYTWCMDCIFVDATAGFLALCFESEISLALFFVCIALIPVHAAYMQYGVAHFPEYKVIVPTFECIMLFFCVIGGINELYPNHKGAAIIRKCLGWVFYNLKFI